MRPTRGGFPTKRDALAWACSGGEKEKPLPKLIDLWQGYSENDLTKLSASKQTAYKIARKRLESIIGRRIDTLTVDDLQAVVNSECQSYYTAKDVKDLLSNLYQRAMASNANKGRITMNLSSFIVMPEYEEKEAVPFTEEELSKLWEAYNNGDSFIGYILLMCYTGIMTGELLKCKSSMVDLDRCEIYGVGSKTKIRKKSSIAFPVYIKPVIESMLSTDKLIHMNKDNFYTEFYKAIDRVGIYNPVIDNRHRLTPYSCRHTFGTEAVKAGFHPAIIQKMLRHSNTKTQEKYTHLASSDIHDAVDSISCGLHLGYTEAENR